MELVRAHHTFEHRADVLLAQVAALVEERPFPVRVRPAPAGS
jgi:hypothetical protein